MFKTIFSIKAGCLFLVLGAKVEVYTLIKILAIVKEVDNEDLVNRP